MGTIIHLAVDGTYAGHIVISDTVKEHSREAIRKLKAAGVKQTVMLTGDARQVAEAVAAELGVDQVYSELLPADKVTKVEELLEHKAPKEKLAFVGDGINDARAVPADIAAPWAAMGSDAAIEAADVVLMDDDPLKIAKAIRISRKCTASSIRTSPLPCWSSSPACPGGRGHRQYVAGHLCRCGCDGSGRPQRHPCSVRTQAVRYRKAGGTEY